MLIFRQDSKARLDRLSTFLSEHAVEWRYKGTNLLLVGHIAYEAPLYNLLQKVIYPMFVKPYTNNPTLYHQCFNLYYHKNGGVCQCIFIKPMR